MCEFAHQQKLWNIEIIHTNSLIYETVFFYKWKQKIDAYKQSRKIGSKKYPLTFSENPSEGGRKTRHNSYVKNYRKGVGVSWHMKYYLKIIFICYIKICLHTWIYINEIKGFVGTIHKWGIVGAIHMLLDTPGGGVVSWHMKYKIKCIFIHFVQICLDMWIIIPKKMRIWRHTS